MGPCISGCCHASVICLALVAARGVFVRFRHHLHIGVVCPVVHQAQCNALLALRAFGLTGTSIVLLKPANATEVFDALVDSNVLIHVTDL